MEIYKTKFQVEVYQTDLTDHWQIGHVANCFQEMATQHGIILDVGRDRCDALGVAWVISRLRVQMFSYPVYGEPLIGKTWFSPVARCICPRHYTVERTDGTLVAAGTSLYVLLNTANRTLANNSMLEDLSKKSAPVPPQVSHPGKIRCPKDAAWQTSFRTPLYSDIDINGHMNNTRYIQWLCDLLPLDCFKARGISFVQVNYIQEALPEQEMILEFFSQDENFWLKGKNASNEAAIFEATGAWGIDFS